MTEAVAAYAKPHEAGVVIISAEIESQLAQLPEDEQKEFTAINWTRYQLDHLNYKLATMSLSSDKDQLRPVFLTHLTQTKKEIETILGGLI